MPQGDFIRNKKPIASGQLNKNNNGCVAVEADLSYTAKGAQPKLPHEHIQAQRFSKTRAAQSRAVLEDYVELIGDLLGAEGEARITDVASRLGVSHPTAIKTISRLKREGLASGRPYRGVFLTDEGRKLAKRVKARHRIIVDGLIALGVPRRRKPTLRASSITFLTKPSKHSHG